MATKTNIKDVGWMYHTPGKQKERDNEHQAVILSQIPLLSQAEIEDPNLTNKQANYIKPTDSEYIALCKMGGRKNLLSMKEPTKKSDVMQSYPRCDWFYLLDNQLEDDQNKPDQIAYRAQVPSYMVHDVYEKKTQPVQNIQIQIDENPPIHKAKKKKSRAPSTDNKSKNHCSKSASKQDPVVQNAKIAEKREKKVEEPIDMFKLLSYGYLTKKIDLVN